MPVILNAVGSTLDAVILDDNFETIQDLCRSGVLTADLLATFDRYKVTRYTGGRLRTTTVGTNPLLLKERGPVDGELDISYRVGTEDAGDQTTVNSRVEADTRSAYAMELLGKPGPSFHLQWQEDSRAAPVAGGWPPSWWPINRYPKELCFSRWLTIPDCAVRVFPDEPCIARITATAKGSLNMFRLLSLFSAVVPFKPTNNAVMNHIHAGRFGLVVDTNPRLFTDEFATSNPNILDPISGAQAGFVSWRILEDHTFNLPQRAIIQMSSEVALKGRRHYNFSMKFRDAAHHGWVDISGPTWQDTIWESGIGGAAPNAPVMNSFWTGFFTALGFPASATYYKKAFYPNWIALWENCSITVEFDYGRDEAFVTDSTNAEFTSKPT